MTRIDPGHGGKRTALRVIGLLLLVCGVSLIAIGFASVFGSFGSFEPPKYSWCLFLGMPVAFVGLVLTLHGFMGAVARYQADEVAPVGIDTFNYMADGTKDGVRTVAAAIGEGLSSGAQGAATAESVRCLQCNAVNARDAQFCDQCGFALRKTKPCPSCGEQNDPDARFCDKCGQEIGSSA